MEHITPELRAIINLVYEFNYKKNELLVEALDSQDGFSLIPNKTFEQSFSYSNGYLYFWYNDKKLKTTSASRKKISKELNFALRTGKMREYFKIARELKK